MVFNVQDEDGNQPDHEIIDSKCKYTRLKTTLDLQEIVKNIETEFKV
jgi:hypothetical protein